MDADVVASGVADLSEKHRDAVDVGIAADQPGVAVARGLVHHVLAAAESHLQPDLPVSERGPQIQRAALGVLVPTHRPRRQPGEILVEARLLRGPQPLSLQPAVEFPPPGRRPGGPPAAPGSVRGRLTHCA